MTRSFDDRARAAAERSRPAGSARPPLTRRRLLQRTAVIGTVTWAAPTLLSASPAWAASSCRASSSAVYPGNDYVATTTNVAVERGTYCNRDYQTTTSYCVGSASVSNQCCPYPGALATSGTIANACPGFLGGICRTNPASYKSGACIGGNLGCARNQGTTFNSICGDVGAGCFNNSYCVYGNCTTQQNNPDQTAGQATTGRCGGPGARCSAPSQCVSGFCPTNPTPRVCT